MRRLGPAAILLSILACAAPPPVTLPPAPRVDAFAVTPNAAAADPRAPVSIRFAVHACETCQGCEVDPESLARALVISPTTSSAPTVRLDPVRCEARVEAPWRLSTDYAITIGTTLTDTQGTPLAEPATFTFHTAGWYPGEALPRLVGSWPPSGDGRLGPTSPIALLFDREVPAEVVKVLAPVPMVLETIEGWWALWARPTERWPAGEIAVEVSLGVEGASTLRLVFPRPGGVDDVAPSFAGASALEPVESGVRVRWAAATDDVSEAATIRYLVYVGRDGGAPDVRMPSFLTEPGATELVLGAASGLRVIVRAQDEAGNVDPNEIVQVGP